MSDIDRMERVVDLLAGELKKAREDFGKLSDQLAGAHEAFMGMNAAYTRLFSGATKATQALIDEANAHKDAGRDPEAKRAIAAANQLIDSMSEAQNLAKGKRSDE